MNIYLYLIKICTSVHRTKEDVRDFQKILNKAYDLQKSWERVGRLEVELLLLVLPLLLLVIPELGRVVKCYRSL